MIARIFFICMLVVSCFFLTFPAAFAGNLEVAPQKSGFYLTADIGGATFQKQRSVATNVIVAGPAIAGGVSELQITGRNALSIAWGAGIGWQFNALFRMDIAYTYLRFPLIFHNFNTASLGPPTTSIAFSSGRSSVYLINVYVDLLRFFGQRASYFNPYVGAGFGWADNKTKNSTLVINTAPIVRAFISTAHRIDFAYRLIAGFTYPLTRGLRIFAQYDYLCAGKYEGGTRLATSIGNGIFTVPPKFHIHSNIFSAGFIYLF